MTIEVIGAAILLLSGGGSGTCLAMAMRADRAADERLDATGENLRLANPLPDTTPARMTNLLGLLD